MEDNFEKHLNKSIKLLPGIDHDKNLWDKIASELDFEERLEQTCKTLPIHEHSEHLWDKIQNHEAHRARNRRLIYAYSIAASILLFIISYTFYTNTKDYTITRSTEILNNTVQIFEDTANKQNIDTMLQQLCQYSNLNCDNPGFIQLKDQIIELETEIKKLNRVIHTYGESPSLIKSLIKLENQKAGMINEYIKKSTT